MMARVRFLALCLVAMLAVGALALPAAWAVEPEAPFWSVAGKRLGAEKSKKAFIKDSSTEAILHSKIGTTEVEIKCKGGAFEEGNLEGSAAKHSGKASGVLELKECKLFAKEGESFKEQANCEVPTIKSGKLTGKLWLEGTKAAAGTKPVIVFEPKELTEGKQVIAKIAINKETCTYKGTYSLEGNFAGYLLPQGEEFSYIQWVFPTTLSTVWHPASEEGEATVSLKLGGNTASLEVEEKAELETQEKFGGGAEPVAGIEAPFWGVGGKRLESGKEKELESKTITGEAKWKIPIKSKETETRCKKVVIKKSKVIGSLGQHDGKFVAETIEFTECTFYVKEGGVFVQQTKCEVLPISTPKISGRLWLEGTKSERKQSPILVLEPESLTEGKKLFAEQTVKNKGAEVCGVVEEHYKIDGNIAVKLHPENAETEVLGLSFPTKPPTKVWQSAEQEAEISVGLEHEGSSIEVEVEVPTALSGGEKFGGGVGGPGGVGSGGPYWHVNGGTLGAGVSKAIKDELSQPKALTLFAEAGNKKISISCEKAPSTGRLWNGTQHGESEDRIEFKTNCKVFEIVGTEQVEIKECSVKEPVTAEAASSLWYETKASGATTERTGKLRDVFAPTQKGGKVFAKVTLSSAGCGALEGVFSVEGNFASIIEPEYGEVEKITLSNPTEQIKHVWHPTSQQIVESQLELKFNAKEAKLVGKQTVELSSKERFGAFES